MTDNIGMQEFALVMSAGLVLIGLALGFGLGVAFEKWRSDDTPRRKKSIFPPHS